MLNSWVKTETSYVLNGLRQTGYDGVRAVLKLGLMVFELNYFKFQNV